MLIQDTWGHYLQKSLRENKDKIAIIDINEHTRSTYRDLLHKSKAIEKALIGSNITRGTHVALIFPNSITWISMFLALINIGAVPVCINSESVEEELIYQIKYADVKAIFTDEDTYRKIKNSEQQMDLELMVIVDRQDAYIERVYMSFKTFIKNGELIDDQELNEARAKVRYDDILAVQYTSGTTGRPKAVMSVHYKVLNNIIKVGEIFKYTSEDKLFSSLPMYHVMGCFFSCLLIFMVGGSLVIMKKFSTEQAIRALQEEKCTCIHGVPTMFKLILNKMEDRKFSALDKGMIAGAYCDEKTMDDIINKMDIKNIMPLYGQSEACGYTQIRLGDPVEKIKGTVGRAIEGVEIKIVDDNLEELPTNTQGEILVKSKYFMQSYYKNQEATNQIIIDGWMHTGDLGALDEEGYLKITGRKKDIIIKGGENISPADIERTLRQHSRIKDVVVVGIPDEIMGQEIAAFIILNSTCQLVREEEVIEELNRYIERNLSKIKRPKYIRFIEKFPITGSGKIQKFKLVQAI